MRRCDHSPNEMCHRCNPLAEEVARLRVALTKIAAMAAWEAEQDAAQTAKEALEKDP